MADETDINDTREDRRQNARRFIDHRTAFVYSDQDYALLRELTHDGLEDPPPNEAGRREQAT